MGVEGSWFKPVLVAKKVPEHLQSHAEVPFSKVPNPQNAQLGPCDEVAPRGAGGGTLHPSL